MASRTESSKSEPGTRSETRAPRMRHGHVVSQAPGRMRVRLHRNHRAPAELTQIEQGLARQAGVTAVTTNARTGSVLIHYDHRALSKDDVTALLSDVGVIAREVLGMEELPEDLGQGVAAHSSTASGLLDALTDLDQRLSALTGGRVDVKLLVPAGLGLIALRQLMTVGIGLAEVPAYVLLWYTFDSFYKLHQRRTMPVTDPSGEPIATQSAGEPDKPDSDAATRAATGRTYGRRRSDQSNRPGAGDA